jgi:AraC family transcriptional regulator
MNGRLSTLFESETVRVQDYCCREEPGSISTPEQTQDFEITYTRTGEFIYHDKRESRPIDNSLLWLLNPNSEYRVEHNHNVRDTCTIFRFPLRLLREIAEQFSTMDSFIFQRSFLPVSSHIDYYHSQILRELQTKTKIQTLRIDSLSIDFLKEIFQSLFHSSPTGLQLHDSEWLERIERAKSYILKNFDQDLSLREIARNAFLSEFHFSRIFRSVTNRSPHQYLLDVRFQHAVLLLRNTSDSITQICFACGFQNYPHFIAAFTRRYGISPLQFKKQKSKFS